MNSFKDLEKGGLIRAPKSWKIMWLYHWSPHFPSQTADHVNLPLFATEAARKAVALHLWVLLLEFSVFKIISLSYIKVCGKWGNTYAIAFYIIKLDNINTLRESYSVMVKSMNSGTRLNLKPVLPSTSCMTRTI